MIAVLPKNIIEHFKLEKINTDGVGTFAYKFPDDEIYITNFTETEFSGIHIFENIVIERLEYTYKLENNIKVRTGKNLNRIFITPEFLEDQPVMAFDAIIADLKKA